VSSDSNPAHRYALHGSSQTRTLFCQAVHDSGKEIFFEGIVKGKIGTERHGKGGFGYDPVFIPDGFEETFSQMDFENKNLISHRGAAVRKLADYLKKI
jgi:XTP/dITP diphosphohydrolase